MIPAGEQADATDRPAPPLAARLDGITRYYDTPDGANRLHALGPIDLHLKKGEFVSVIGPSGCGKSTLLDVLSGLSAPTGGTAFFEGKPIDGVPGGVGVVFQEDASFPWLTVEANVAFGLKRAGLEGTEIARRVKDALDLMGLRDFAKAMPAHLSGGMRQRVCIARTLVLQPHLILLDEPFGALDQQTRLVMGEELLRLWRETQATVLLITHSIDEAVMLSDRVAVMSARPGRIIDMLETGWQADRDSRIVTDPRFGDLSARIWSTLRVETMKHLQADTGHEP